MSEHRRDSDNQGWFDRNWIALLSMIGSAVVAIVIGSIFFGRTVEKVNAYEPRIIRCESSCDQIPTLNGKMEVVISLLDPTGEKRKMIGRN